MSDHGPRTGGRAGVGPPGASDAGVPASRIIVKGIAVAPGLAVGMPVFHDDGDVDIPVLALSMEDVKGEQRRLATAIRVAKQQLAEVEANIEKEVGRRDARIFSVQSVLLEDPGFRKAIRERIAAQLVNAEVAVRDAVAAWSARLSGVGVDADRDPVADLRDVGRRLLRILAGRPAKARREEIEHERIVLVTRELLPSDTAHVDRKRLAAIVTASGGVASHAAILARGLGIPAVTDVEVGSLPAAGGAWIVDGTDGRVVLNPDADDLDQARRQSQHFQEVRHELQQQVADTVTTRCGTPVDLMLNVENFDHLDAGSLRGLRGVGLFRTEFLFMERTSFPSEEEQYTSYVRALEQAGDAEITFRTIDVGGDKPLSYLSLPNEPNPVLGWRGIRLSLQWPDMFLTQLRALLRASAHGRMRILLPMVTMVEEFQRARSMLEQVRTDLAAHDVPHDPQVPLGAMIEVPAAALAARSLAREADFLSIGTNDLSQYALAVDRNNARVAGLYQTLHPGVLQLLRIVMNSVPEAEKRVSVCGEMAGDADAVLLLLGLGVRALSMSPYHLPVVRRLLQAVTIEEAEALTEKVLDMGSTAQIRSALRAETLRLVPDLSTLLGPS